MPTASTTLVVVLSDRHQRARRASALRRSSRWAIRSPMVLPLHLTPIGAGPACFGPAPAVHRSTAHLAVLNQGISGNRTLFDLIGPNAQARLDRDVLNAPGARFVIFLEGINNIGFSGIPGLTDQAVSADDIIAGHQQIIASRARARPEDLWLHTDTVRGHRSRLFHAGRRGQAAGGQSVDSHQPSVRCSDRLRPRGARSGASRRAHAAGV